MSILEDLIRQLKGDPLSGGLINSLSEPTRQFLSQVSAPIVQPDTSIIDNYVPTAVGYLGPGVGDMPDPTGVVQKTPTNTLLPDSLFNPPEKYTPAPLQPITGGTSSSGGTLSPTGNTVVGTTTETPDPQHKYTPTSPTGEAGKWRFGYPGAPNSKEAKEYAKKNIVPVKVGGATIQIHKDVAPLFQGFMEELSKNGYVFDPKTTGGYNSRWKNIMGKPQVGNLSEHASGLAVDLNWNKNTQGQRGTDLPKNVRDLAAKYGLKWGMDFKTPDPMHFDFSGSAEDAKNLVVKLGLGPKPDTKAQAVSILKRELPGTGNMLGPPSPATKAAMATPAKEQVVQKLQDSGLGTGGYAPGLEARNFVKDAQERVKQLNPALQNLIMRESAGRVDAYNPVKTSTGNAFGISQLTDQNRAKYAKQLGIKDPNTKNWDEQLAMMNAYIQERYKTPEAAWAHWQRHKWY